MAKIVRPSFGNTKLSQDAIKYSFDGYVKDAKLGNNVKPSNVPEMNYKENIKTISIFDQAKINSSLFSYNNEHIKAYEMTGAHQALSITSSIRGFIERTIKPKFRNAKEVVEGKIHSLLQWLGIEKTEKDKEDVGLKDYSPNEEETTKPAEPTEVAHDRSGSDPKDEKKEEPKTEPTTVPTTEPETTEPTTKPEPTTEEPKSTEPETTEKPASTEHKHFDIPLSESEQEIVYECAEKYGLDPAIVFAVIETESSFNKNIGVNSYNCAGLMQLNLTYSAQYGVTYDNYNDVYTNVNGGCMLLSQLYNKYGDYHKALMAYNYGENGAKKCWDRGQYTSEYSRKVMGRADKYR